MYKVEVTYHNPYLVMKLNTITEKKPIKKQPKKVNKEIRKIDQLRYLDLVRTGKVDIYA